MKMIDYVLVLLFVALFGLLAGGLYGTLTQAADKDILWSGPEVKLELIATSDDGDVKYYRLVDMSGPYGIPSVCYSIIGELHGKTVAMECK